MEIEVLMPQKFDAKFLAVDAGVRYWEDAEINGRADTEEGEHIPCKVGDSWKPVIELETGKIIGWPMGCTANIHYKVCDNGNYYINDESGITILQIINDYVPDILCPTESGDGDYIIMYVNEYGYIKDWKADADTINEDFNPVFDL